MMRRARVMRRPRVVWLLDSADPTGAAVMTMRRVQVLGDRVRSTVLALDAAQSRPPAASPLRAVGRVGGLPAEVAVARADVVVSSSETTLISAAARLTGRARHVHFLHSDPASALTLPRVVRGLPTVTRLVVPAASDPRAVAAAAALPASRVVAADDFVLPDEVIPDEVVPGTARAHVFLAAGRIEQHSPLLDLVDAFALAALPGWQLRIAGGGPGLPELLDHVDARDLAEPRSPGTVLVLGPRHDLPALYADAGVLVRLVDVEAAGLSVLEALDAGVPVLGSPGSPAVRRHVRHGANGWVLDRVDPAAVAEALVEAADDGRRAALANVARRERVGLLRIDQRQALHRLFDDVLAEGPAAGLDAELETVEAAG